ncbi:GPW/gp25 family protein [Ruegeria hyattellae]|uniref:GPW/gp25 family protein n=1 Tax=Ruegeria hyattellae TaxID=3233337 RepID=UPI00355BE890
MTHIDYPFGIDTRGRTRRTEDAEYVRDLIEQVLFTNPGERVNRPNFGSGILQAVFAPNSDALAATIEASVKAALDQWVSDLAQVETIRARADEEKLIIDIIYRLRRTGERRETRLERVL